MKNRKSKMKKLFSTILTTAFVAGCVGQAYPAITVNAESSATRYARVMECIDRGLIAIPKSYGEEAKGMYLSWRMLGTESLADTTFDIYKNGKMIVSGYNGTNYTDTTNSNGSDTSAVYQVVQSGKELTSDDLPANTVLVNGNQIKLNMTGEHENNSGSVSNSYGYFDIPLSIPAGVTDDLAGTYSYSANDCSVGDVDGDGQYELIVKWDPSNAQDNSKSGYTGDVLFSCYEFDGTQLWSNPINLGKNIRAGAHYTQFMVYDLDGDGFAEIVMKTAPGSRDAKGNYVSEAGDSSEIRDTDNTMDYRESSGHLLKGPEYLTVFNGKTGAAMYTTDYTPPYSVESDWQDNYGNRGNRFLACVGYFGNKDSAGNLLPSVVMCRGYYTQAHVVAYDWDGTKLTQRFYHQGSDNSASTLYGQGNHNLTVTDVDNDGYDEIVYGSAVLDHDGKVLSNTRLGHGDALHVNDFNNDGTIEVFQVHEDEKGYKNYGGDFWIPATGEHIYGLPAGGDTGRGVMANIDDEYAKTNSDALSMGWTSSTSEAFDIKGNAVAAKPSSSSRSMDNSLVYWDGDLGRELLDDNQLAKYQASTGWTLRFYFGKNSWLGIESNNSTKRNACLTADVLGDWREEIIGRNGNSLRVYVSALNTDYKLTTLMHDSQYRLSVATENVAYNQPPHTSYYIGSASLAAEDANYLTPAYAYTVVTTPKEEVLSPTITIQIEDATRVYGEENPEFTYTYDKADLQGTDTIDKWEIKLSTTAGVTSGVGTYDITGSFKEVEGYKTIIEKGTLTITQAEKAPNMPEDTIKVPFDVKKIGQVQLPENWSWQEKDLDTALYVDEAATAVAVYTGKDAANYKKTEVAITITREPLTFSFADVDAEGWEYKGIYYSYQRELMSGNSDTVFAPWENLTRSQFATVLYSYAGKPEYKYEDCFTDVVDGAWYSIPIVWAADNNVTSGYVDGRFGVNDDITREQFVTMLYGYAKSSGVVTKSPTGELSSYGDASLVDNWAVEPMLWATQNGLLTGRPAESGEGMLLDPDGTATRAQCATIMMQFDKMVRGVAYEVEAE